MATKTQNNTISNPMVAVLEARIKATPFRTRIHGDGLVLDMAKAVASELDAIIPPEGSVP
jgi:hypothetical protein